MKISEIYNTGKKSLSFEIFPPKKDSELKNIDETLEVLSGLNPDFISVTFGAGGGFNRNRTIELAKKVKYEYHVEPVVHLTCLCYDRKEIDEFSKVLSAEGIENILALRGDRNPDIKEKEDFRHASDLIRYIKGKGDFCVAGACYPECHPESANMEDELKYLKEKADSGAEILISQLFFDNADFFEFYKKCKDAGINIPIIPGIMPVINASQINRMVTMCGASMPKKLQETVDRYKDDKDALFDAGTEYAMNQVTGLLSNGAAGIHLYTMNNPEVAKRICKGIIDII